MTQKQNGGNWEGGKLRQKKSHLKLDSSFHALHKRINLRHSAAGSLCIESNENALCRKGAIHSVEQTIFTVSVMGFHHTVMALGILPTIIILYGRIKVRLQRQRKCLVVVTICPRINRVFIISTGAFKTCQMKNKGCQVITASAILCIASDLNPTVYTECR